MDSKIQFWEYIVWAAYCLLLVPIVVYISAKLASVGWLRGKQVFWDGIRRKKKKKQEEETNVLP